MKKIISFLVLITLFFSGINISFAEVTNNSNSSCKEEIIENALYPIFSPNSKNFAYVKQKEN
jgi:hypothetical protein